MIAPVQPGQPKCEGYVPGGEPLAEFYENGFYPESPIAIVDEFIMRGHRVVNVQMRQCATMALRENWKPARACPLSFCLVAVTWT